MQFTPGCIVRKSPISEPFPVTQFIRPLGKPAKWKQCTIWRQETAPWKEVKGEIKRLKQFRRIIMFKKHPWECWILIHKCKYSFVYNKANHLISNDLLQITDRITFWSYFLLIFWPWLQSLAQDPFEGWRFPPSNVVDIFTFSRPLHSISVMMVAGGYAWRVMMVGNITHNLIHKVKYLSWRLENNGVSSYQCRTNLWHSKVDRIVKWGNG